MNTLLVLPIVIPLVSAIAALLVRQSLAAQRWLGVLGSGALAVTGIVLLLAVRDQGIQVTQVGDWPAPFGITLVADMLAAIMVALAGLMGLAVSVYSVAGIDRERAAFGYFPLLQILLMGVCGAFLTGDLFNLFVWFEVMLMSSFVLLALGGERGQLEAAIKYVTLNLLSSALFLAAVGIVYALTGTLNMADLAIRLPEVASPGLVTTLSMLFLIAFGIKAAIFPLFFWLPASYPAPPVAVAAIFAGLLTKVGVYALLRVFSLLFTTDQGYTHRLILIIAGVTMLTGILGALAQRDLRRTLSFLVIGSIGYPLMGLGLFSELALAGAILYLMAVIVAKTNLFLAAGLVERLRGVNPEGLWVGYPLVGLAFLFPALSLSGIPPFFGFFAKFALVRAGLETSQWLITGIALVVGLLSLLITARVWAGIFWRPLPAEGGPPLPVLLSRRDRYAAYVPVATLALLSLVFGILAEPLMNLSLTAAGQLLDPSIYVETVLGGTAP
jgi:multicomponent Na+:H+ antiporter subunit D